MGHKKGCRFGFQLRRLELPHLPPACSIILKHRLHTYETITYASCVCYVDQTGSPAYLRILAANTLCF